MNSAAAETEVPQGLKPRIWQQLLARLNRPLKKSKSRSLVGLKRLCRNPVSPLCGSGFVPL